jgi:hypothetical protein
MVTIKQICPAPPYVAIAWYDPTANSCVKLVKPVCIALTEKGKITDVVYMENVDDGIDTLDTKHKDFLGIAESEEDLTAIKFIAMQRNSKEQNEK